MTTKYEQVPGTQKATKVTEHFCRSSAYQQARVQQMWVDENARVKSVSII